jgi:NAD-specific glutamate dehydrogenase
MGFRLSTLDSTTKANEGVWVDIGDPRTGQPTGLQVKILGSDSKAYKATEKEIREQVMKGTSFNDADGELSIRTTLDWRVVDAEGSYSKPLDDKGKEVPFSQEELKRAFEKYPTIRDQIVLKQKSRAVFMAAASAN